MRKPPHSSPGFQVPNSRVFLPASAAAGGTVEGRAPAGSTIEAFGLRQTVAADGRFRLAIPADASGAHTIRVRRPHMTPLSLRIDVTGAAAP
ncbi:hypothetical protein [Luteimonas aquatica]|uniref:hypothetical protein n=1 Tax=Luteimonas aquatica TaxID=450364 RepID=UPI001F59F6C5|nr:hypothetical protein [Luteimonas aquatica]